ncbi:CPBP family intramembrane metalloprotease [Periweissella cryptocerci]|uniref:CPBP family intramembrane metalloprotease n=1 Tax=Periweissella cryptocerci TaxID=2506420 RepID=A0A4P6YU65_9LACO|nr:CPBP family intramembrane glutamic endopeptidase [Periweissella cryptocerci]QBO36270.1 CPBP family intramembrane metalloprotease [Periweissella cryptocerci]
MLDVCGVIKNMIIHVPILILLCIVIQLSVLPTLFELHWGILTRYVILGIVSFCLIAVLWIILSKIDNSANTLLVIYGTKNLGIAIVIAVVINHGMAMFYSSDNKYRGLSGAFSRLSGQVGSTQISKIVLSILVVCVIAPIIEELLFRGVVISYLLSVGVPNVIIYLLSAVIFCVAHGVGDKQAFVSNFLFGIIACYLRVHDKSLGESMVLHGVANSVSMLIMNVFF